MDTIEEMYGQVDSRRYRNASVLVEHDICLPRGCSAESGFIRRLVYVEHTINHQSCVITYLMARGKYPVSSYRGSP